jgi:hypothetical protein
MPFPTTLDELKAAGYKFENESHCKGCRVAIEWWKTPNAKFMPFDVDGSGKVETHWSTCPKAKDFRKERA